MPPETEVITCPACNHLVRVPADWLGQTVQCPECKATFRAPVRDGGRPTTPEPLSGPPASAAAARKPADAALWLPAFGLMLLGVISLIVNGVTLVLLAQDPQGYEQAQKDQMEKMVNALANAGIAFNLPKGAENPQWGWTA